MHLCSFAPWLIFPLVHLHLDSFLPWFVFLGLICTFIDLHLSYFASHLHTGLFSQWYICTLVYLHLVTFKTYTFAHFYSYTYAPMHTCAFIAEFWTHSPSLILQLFWSVSFILILYLASLFYLSTNIANNQSLPNLIWQDLVVIWEEGYCSGRWRNQLLYCCANSNAIASQDLVILSPIDRWLMG